MRIVAHIVAKDLARLRWILVLWALTLATGLALAVIQTRLDHETYFPFYIGANVIAIGFGPLLAFGLVMGLVHDDPVADEDAFWITKPISPGQLLAAKGATLLVLALIPLLVAAPYWLFFQLNLTELGTASGELLERHFLVTLLAMPWAVISANGSKFVMNVLLAAAAALLLLFLGPLLSAHATPISDTLVHTRVGLIMALWFAATLAVVCNQFYFRQTKRSLVILAAAAVASLAVGVVWPLELGVSTAVKKNEVGAGRAEGETSSSRIANRQNLWPGTRTLVEVPLRSEARAAREGFGLNVHYTLLDLTGVILVVFTDVEPIAPRSLVEMVSRSGATSREPRRYLIVNPTDGRGLEGRPESKGSELEMAGVRFTHLILQVRPSEVWREKTPPDLRAWLDGARLIRVATAEVVAESSPEKSIIAQHEP